MGENLKLMQSFVFWKENIHDIWRFIGTDCLNTLENEGVSGIVIHSILEEDH